MTMNGSGIMTRIQMTEHVTTLAVLVSFGLFASCSSDNGKAVGTAGGTSIGGATSAGGASNTGGTNTNGGFDTSGDAGDPNCVTSNGFLCPPDLKGMPFVRFVVYYTDFGVGSTDPAQLGESTVTLSQPEPGKLCLSGRASPGGLAGFNLELAKRENILTGTNILEAFDAPGHNITQLAFTLDSPPSKGVGVFAQMMVHAECPNNPSDCTYPPNFWFANVTAPGPVIAPLADFKLVGNPGAFDASVVLDTSKLVNFLFQVEQGDYNFCIHDLRFLDAQGNVVEP